MRHTAVKMTRSSSGRASIFCGERSREGRTGHARTATCQRPEQNSQVLKAGAESRGIEDACYGVPIFRRTRAEDLANREQRETETRSEERKNAWGSWGIFQVRALHCPGPLCRDDHGALLCSVRCCGACGLTPQICPFLAVMRFAAGADISVGQQAWPDAIKGCQCLYAARYTLTSLRCG